MNFENIILNNLNDPIVVVDSDCIVQYANKAAIQKLGNGKDLKGLKCYVEIWEGAEHCDDCPLKMDLKKDFYMKEICDESRDICWEVLFSIIRDDRDKTKFVIERFRNINKQKRYERQLNKLGHIDSLTGIFTKDIFTRNLEREFARANRRKEELSIYITQVDQLKQIIDKRGRKKADDILAGIGKYLAEHIRMYDSAYRYSSNSFAVILPETPEKDAKKAAKRIKDKITERWGVTLSVGYMSSSEVAIPDEMIRGAEGALNLVRDLGGNDIKGG